MSRLRVESALRVEPISRLCVGNELKIKISKIGLRHVLSWAKLGLEAKYHDPGSFGGFGEPGQTNRQDSCFISIDRCLTSVNLKK